MANYIFYSAYIYNEPVYESEKGQELSDFAKAMGKHYAGDCIDNDKPIKTLICSNIYGFDKEGNEYRLDKSFAHIFTAYFNDEAEEYYQIFTDEVEAFKSYKDGILFDSQQ